MPRARRGLPTPAVEPAADPAPDLEGWGVPPEDLDDEPPDDPGAPPPVPIAVEPSTLPSEGLQALGAPPGDTLAAEKWAHSVLMRQAYETMMSSLPETVRRKEVRTILRDAKGHVTDAARYDYMRLVERDRSELDNKKRGRAAAVAVTRGAPPTGAKIIPLIPPDE